MSTRSLLNSLLCSELSWHLDKSLREWWGGRNKNQEQHTNYAIFNEICSPRHTDGRWTGRKAEESQADALTAGRPNTSLTISVTLWRDGMKRLEMACKRCDIIYQMSNSLEISGLKSLHAAWSWPWQQRGRRPWTTSQSPAVVWNSIQGEEPAGSLPFQFIWLMCAVE